jgi:hypothetical protein
MSTIAKKNKKIPTRTLQEIIPLISMLSVFEKLKLIRILADEVEKNSKNIFPFESGKTYQIETPYNMYGAADLLSKSI